MRPLILTNNPNLASTSRVLMQWLTGDGDRLDACVVTQREGDFSNWLEANSIPHQVSPMPQPSKRWPLPGMWYAWRIASWARAQNVDVIHCNEHDVYPFALMVKRLLQVPIVCHVRFRISGEFCRWAFGKSSRQPDALLWTSRQQQIDCAEAIEGVVAQDKQHIIPLGVDLNRIGDVKALRSTIRRAWGIDEDAIVLAQACALRPIKQLEHFVDRVADLSKQDSRVVGLIAGEAPPGGSSYRDELERYADRALLGNRLRWLGHVDPIEPLMAGADIFVSTSQYETFGNSVCESMACGTPVVGYEGGSVKEVVGDTGRMVTTGDKNGLGAAVRELVADGAERKELGRRARERVAACFNPASSLLKLKEIYASILEPRSAQRWAA